MEAVDLMDIKESLQKKQSERDRLLGKKESLFEQLKDLGFDSLKDSESAMDKLEIEINEEEELLKKDTDAFQKRFSGILDAPEELLT